MIANFNNPLSPQEPDDYEKAFVKEVSTQEIIEPERSLRMDRLLAIGWALILIKSIAVWWACEKYAVPIHPLWVILPTMIFGVLCTTIYLQRR